MSDTQTNQTAEKKSKITARASDIRKIVREDLHIVDNKGEKAIDWKEDTLQKTLPEDLTLETCSKVTTFMDDLATGTAGAIGDFATEQVAAGVFNEKDGVQSLNAHLSLWDKNFLNMNYTKEKTHTGKNPKNPSETITSTKFGDIRAQYEMNATQNRGQFKQIKNEINDLAEAAFAAGNK